ncbi:MAG: ROK family glucokinase [Eubacterium sp.]|nr:ROK family glucokinase [Eubacterium sp.]
MATYYVGVDVGGTTIKLGLFSDIGELLEKWEIPTRTEENGTHVLPDIVDSIEEKRASRGGNIKGIGMGIPGPVTADGVVLKCANLGWGVFSVKNTLADLTGVGNVKVGNDANVAALGEMWKGGGRGYDSIVMVTLGTGVGGGIIQNGKILTGSRGAGGEIGHIKVEMNETEACGCGNYGCLEQYASATGIVRMAKNGLPADSCLAKADELTAKEVFDGARASDAYCMEIVERFGKYLGVALSNVAHVMDPEAFVIGGGVSAAGEMILDVVKKYYEANAMYAIRDKKFRLAELGNDAGIYGAVRMILF